MDRPIACVFYKDIAPVLSAINENFFKHVVGLNNILEFFKLQTFSCTLTKN